MEDQVPNLARHAIVDWISTFGPAATLRCTVPFTPTEEEPGVQVSLEHLGQAFDDTDGPAVDLTTVLDRGEPGRDLLAIMTQLGTARLVRLLHWLGNEDKPDRGQVLSDLLGGKYGPTPLLREAIRALHRQELLHRIFDEQRLELLLASTRLANEGIKQ